MKLLAMFIAATLLLTVPVSAQSLDPGDPRLLRRSLNERPYRLWVPADYDGSRSYPLVLFLHGGAGRGRDNERHLLDGNGMLINMFVTAQPRFPSIVLAPQTSSEHGVEPTLAVLRHVLKEYRVDRSTSLPDRPIPWRVRRA